MKVAAKSLCFSLMFAAVLSLASNAFGQGEPVDQAVGDLDQLSTSLRQMNKGLRSDGEQSSLYRVDPQATTPGAYTTHSGLTAKPIYYRVAPGLTAKMDRSNYVVRVGRKQTATNIKPMRDGEFIETIPANTVFILDPRSQMMYQQQDEEAVKVYGPPTLKLIKPGQREDWKEGALSLKRIKEGQPEHMRQMNAQSQSNSGSIDEPVVVKRIAAGQPGGKMVPIEDEQPIARGTQQETEDRRRAAAMQYFNPYQVKAEPIDARVDGSVSRMVDARVSNKIKSTKVSDQPAPGALNYLHMTR